MIPDVPKPFSSAPQEGGGVQDAEKTIGDDVQVDIVQEEDGWVTVIRKKKRRQRVKLADDWTKVQRQTFREEGDLYKMSVADFIEPVHHVAPPQQDLPVHPPVLPPAPQVPEADGANNPGGGNPHPNVFHHDDDDDNDPDDDHAAAAAGAAEHHAADSEEDPAVNPEEDDDEFHDADEYLESPEQQERDPTPRKKVHFGTVTERRRRPGEPHLTLDEAEFIAKATQQSPGRSPRGGGRSTRSSGQTLSPSVLSKYLAGNKRKKK